MIASQLAIPEKPLPVQSRDELILEHLQQVNLIAKRIHKSLPASVSLDDLVSTGTLGLISAVDHYEPSHKVKLKTYAEYKIRGAILDSLRLLDWAPRQTRKRGRILESAIARLEQEHGRMPSEEEIAARLGLPLESYRSWSVGSRGLTLGSLETSGSEEKGRDLLRFISDSEEQWPSVLFERSELARLVAQSIEEIPEVERTVLTLYFYEGLNLREIAEILDLHESRISQLKSQAVTRLRLSLEASWPTKRAPLPAAPRPARTVRA